MTTAPNNVAWATFDARCEYAITWRAAEARDDGAIEAERMRRSIGQQARFALTEWRKERCTK